jgi:hypothetical protein
LSNCCKWAEQGRDDCMIISILDTCRTFGNWNKWFASKKKS